MSSSCFVFLFLAPIVFLLMPIGLVKPELVLRWGKTRTRARSVLWYGLETLLCLGLALFVPFKAGVREVTSPPAEMVGNWEGDGHIMESWCQQRLLHVAIAITPDGKVEGKVGDSTFENAHLGSTGYIANWGDRSNLLGTSQYYVAMNLRGPLLDKENIVLPRGSLGLDPEGAQLHWP